MSESSLPLLEQLRQIQTGPPEGLRLIADGLHNQALGYDERVDRVRAGRQQLAHGDPKQHVLYRMKEEAGHGIATGASALGILAMAPLARMHANNYLDRMASEGVENYVRNLNTVLPRATDYEQLNEALHKAYGMRLPDHDFIPWSRSPSHTEARAGGAGQKLYQNVRRLTGNPMEAVSTLDETVSLFLQDRFTEQAKRRGLSLEEAARVGEEMAMKHTKPLSDLSESLVLFEGKSIPLLEKKWHWANQPEFPKMRNFFQRRLGQQSMASLKDLPIYKRVPAAVGLSLDPFLDVANRKGTRLMLAGGLIGAGIGAITAHNERKEAQEEANEPPSMTRQALMESDRRQAQQNIRSFRVTGPLEDTLRKARGSALSNPGEFGESVANLLLFAPGEGG